MDKKDIKIDKDKLRPEDLESRKIITLDDGSLEEVYISRAGNIVTDPKNRNSLVDINERKTKREKCWEEYVKTWRAGEPSARKAAIIAGYAPNTAINITKMKWFKDKKKKLRRSAMMTNAEKNLARVLRMNFSEMKLQEDGSEKEVVDKDILKAVIDVSKTVVTTLGKDEGYSTKTEVKGDMSGEIKINSVSYADVPTEVENKIVDNSVKVIEGEILKEMKNKDNG